MSRSFSAAISATASALRLLNLGRFSAIRGDARHDRPIFAVLEKSGALSRLLKDQACRPYLLLGKARLESFRARALARAAGRPLRDYLTNHIRSGDRLLVTKYG